MRYEDWSQHSQQEKSQYREDVRGVQRHNEVQADVLSDGLEQEFIAQYGDKPDSRQRWAAIHRGVWKTGRDKQDDYRSKLTSEDQQYFDRLDTITAANLSEVVVSGQRVGKPSAEQDRHDFEAVSSAAQDAKASAENLKHEAARQGGGSPDVRKQEVENSDTAFNTIRSTPSAAAASTADAAIAENAVAGRQAYDQVAKNDFKSTQQMGDDYGDASVVATKAAAPKPVARVDMAASNNPADNTNDLSPLHRAQALMAALDSDGPSSSPSRRPAPYSPSPMR
jgi:hypothetical protein